MTDLAVDFLSDGKTFRFGLGIEAGDLKNDNGLLAAVLYSLFTDRIANADDFIPDGTENRRGHWADPEEGSRLWLLNRAKQTQQTLNLAVEYCREALQWLLDDGIASSVEVEAEWLRLYVLAVRVQIDLIDGERFDEVFEV